MNIEEPNSESAWTNIQVDSQILSSFMSCPREMNYRYNRHLVAISGTSVSFLKGQLAHKALHKYYQSQIDGYSIRDAKVLAIKELNQIAPSFDLDSDNVILVKRTIEEFLEFRQNDSWIPRAAEKLIKFLAYEDSELRLRIILTGRIDLIVSLLANPQQLIPVDHKTESESWFYSALSNQFKIYALATKSNHLFVQRCGFQKTKKAEEKFRQETINFDNDVLDEFQNEVLPYYIKELLLCMDSGYYPPRYSSCIKGHFACTFSDKHQHGVCHLPRAFREAKLERYFEIATEWDPADDA
jgi:hypothetical protein